MTTFTLITDIAHVIELAVAPVFLLAGIAGFLNIMSGRLGRIVDRSRNLRHLVWQNLIWSCQTLYQRRRGGAARGIIWRI